MKISKPLNSIQRNFNELCVKGGGIGGGPARTKVQQLLHDGSKILNGNAFNEISSQLVEFADRDPWKVCFAVSLGWGHLSKIDSEFTDAATRVLTNMDARHMKRACSFYLERGPKPIEQSLAGGFLMFSKVKLPAELPDDLKTFGRAQERWLSPILSNSEPRPKYIGSWNATGMFMVGLFSKPGLAASMTEADVMLPPGGPIFNGLSILHKANLISSPPSGSQLDDEAFEPGSIYENNALLWEIHRGKQDWSLLDVHSGVYMLGTRYPFSDQWT